MGVQNGVAFAPTSSSTQRMVEVTSSNFELMAERKGFGAAPPPPREKSEGQKKRESQSSKYDELASSGGQQYAIFVRKFGSDDESWLPCGAIAVPRGAQVSDAIYANEEALKQSILRTFDKLSEQDANEFEFGYNLKIYPDDPIEVAKKILNQ